MVGCVISDIVIVVKVDLFLGKERRRGVNWRLENRVTELPRKDSKQRGIIKRLYERGKKRKREEEKGRRSIFAIIFFFFPMTSAQLAGSGGVVREPTKNWSTAQIAPKDNQWGCSVRVFIAAHLWLN
jgi:hypothetical protein